MTAPEVSLSLRGDVYGVSKYAFGLVCQLFGFADQPALATSYMVPVVFSNVSQLGVPCVKLLNTSRTSCVVSKTNLLDTAYIEMKVAYYGGC